MADLTITPANVVAAAGATTRTVTAGETITAGQAVYLESDDSLYWLASNDVDDEEVAVAGISLHGALAGQPLTIITGGNLGLGTGTGLTVGMLIFCSATAGGLAPFADIVSTNRMCMIGFCPAANTLTVSIYNFGIALA